MQAILRTFYTSYNFMYKWKNTYKSVPLVSLL